ncbi:MAG: Immunoglobulin I-set domain protein [Pedosphaera sp.]|nr:Immunoglobulin I-set domain protein [Pedosphaera sp.]
MKFLKKLVLASVLLLTTGSLFAADIRTGLVAYWPMNTTVGTTPDTTPDLVSGNALGLTNMTSGDLVAGTNGQAFNFGGTSQYLGILHGTNPLDTGLPVYSTKGYTITMWINGPAGQNNKPIFAEGFTSSTSPLFSIGTRNGAGTGVINVFLRQTTALINNVPGTKIVFDNNWHHVAWVDTGGSGKLYVDGVQDPATFNYTPAAATTLNNTSIGALQRTPAVNFFNGKIDEVACWERALSLAEIQQVMTNGISSPITNAPAITQQPQGNNCNMGDRLNFSVFANGNRPFSYQWYKDGVAIPNGTNSTYGATDLTNAAAINYLVVVSNPVGSATSSVATVTVAADGAANVPAGLLSYWPFDTVNTSPTTNTPDLYSHNDMQLNLMDVTNQVAGYSGQAATALTFDGVQQYGNRVGGFSIYNTTNYSVSFWVNGQGNQTNRQIFGEGTTTNGAIFFLMGTDNTGLTTSLDVKIAPATTDKKSTRPVLDGTWHHVAWVDENGKARLYVDGVLDETDYGYIRSAAFLNTTSVGALLRGAPANYFAGAVDELAVWNRRLSYTEIQQIRTSGIPVPIAAIPPAITTQPTDKTNSVFQGDSAFFSVVASGTSPLAYQWRKNGANILSATTNLLSFASVQPSDSANYTVVITNSAGSVTSSIVRLTVIPYVPATIGEALKVDFDLTGAAVTQPGFASMTLAANPTNFNGVNVTLTGIGVALADRDRGALTNGSADFTQTQIYNDFIFANGTANGNGMRLLIERLAPNTQYGLTIWSWDAISPGARISDWIETASGSTVAITNGYTFDGSILPTYDYDDTFGALLTSSATGKLQIEGRRNGGTSIGVFVNAVRLVAQPTMKITNVGLTNGNIRVTIERQYPHQPIHVEENSDLGSGIWATTSNGVNGEEHGPIAIVEFPASATNNFYRVVSP